MNAQELGEMLIKWPDMIKVMAEDEDGCLKDIQGVEIDTTEGAMIIIL